jgi:kynurenine 3-monooxygenase
MRSKVLSPLHILRRHFDAFLSRTINFVIPSGSAAASALSLTDPFPTKRVKGWTSLYEMVTFRPDVGYSEALRKERWQKEVVAAGVWGVGVGLAGVVGLGAFVGLRHYKFLRL